MCANRFFCVEEGDLSNAAVLQGDVARLLSAADESLRVVNALVEVWSRPLG